MFVLLGVLPDIQKWFNIDKTKAGLLQTIFVCSYMVFAPLFGYLGDRFSRKYVMAIGITIWSATTFLGSLMGKKVNISKYYSGSIIGERLFQSLKYINKKVGVA